MGVDGNGSAELAVSVRGKVSVTALTSIMSELNLSSSVVGRLGGGG